MKKIPLTQGKFAIVDDEDYVELMKYKWYANKSNNTWYAARYDGKSVKTISMHRQIMCAKPGQEIDHKNGNGLDNQKSNLRFATHQQNISNQRLSRNNTSSGYKGVSWYKSNKKWCARIYHNGKYYFLGYFNILKEAAQAYNAAAIELHGEYACLNKVS